MKIDQWLSALYKADNEGKRVAAMANFKKALEDIDLHRAAVAQLRELDALVEARGEGACAYSAKYRSFLGEALK